MKTINSIFRFLGLKEQEEQILKDYPKMFDKNKRPDHKNVADSLTKKGVGKWVGKMSKEDKKTFKKICGTNFKELGYDYEEDS